MAHRRSRNLHSSLSGNTDQERHTNNLFTQMHRRVIASAVFEKFLTVVRGQSEHAIVPQMRLLETLHQPGDLAVRPPNTGVVQLDYLIPFSSQAGSRQIRTVPVCIQVTGAARLAVSSYHFAQPFTLRI